MGNHFHLLLETPEPNLVSGMKWLLSAYSQGWNRAHMRRGHVFQGRYKAVPVILKRKMEIWSSRAKYCNYGEWMPQSRRFLFTQKVS
jgi:REP element-mobilizing transposase RayT